MATFASHGSPGQNRTSDIKCTVSFGALISKIIRENNSLMINLDLTVANMKLVKYYCIHVWPSSNVPANLGCEEYKGEIYLSTNVRLCCDAKMARIKTYELAERFANACIEILENRYGETEVEIAEWSESYTGAISARIEKDSRAIEKRLASGNFAPNVAP